MLSDRKPPKQRGTLRNPSGVVVVARVTGRHDFRDWLGDWRRYPQREPGIERICRVYKSDHIAKLKSDILVSDAKHN